MPRRVYLHIGLPKTGTTSVQETLWHNRTILAEAGVLYPSHVFAEQFLAAIDLQRERYRDWLEPLAEGAWARLAAHIRSWPGNSIVSCELLASATSKQAAHALSTLDFAEVHVVCTARDLARQIPSVWQENVKTGQTTTLPDLLSALRTGEPAETSGLFWDYQDLTQILRTWSAGLPPERVHVVTVPQSGPGVWPRFASAVELDVGRFSYPRHHNTSLGAAEAELLRRLNVRLEVEWAQHSAVVKDQLALEILPGRPEQRAITIPAEDFPWLRKQACQFIDDIRQAGYHVVGDLDELIPVDPWDDTGFTPTPDAELLDVAIDALAGLVPRVPRQWPPARHQLKATLIELSERNPGAMALRRLYWKAKERLR